MADHAVRKSWVAKLKDTAAKLWTQRRKIVSVLVIVLPLVSRVVPDFPGSEIVAALRVYLGA